MKTIVIGDTHGCYRELKKLYSTLKRSGEYNRKTDRLIFLGDYIDRGENSRKVIGFIKQLQKHNNNVIALMGNHEDMLINYRRGIDVNWLYNGCNETIESYEGYEEYFKKDLVWIRNLPLYYEDDYFIYVHAGIDIDKPMSEQNKNTLLWIREPFIYHNNKYNKQVIFGHTPTLSITGETKPVYTYNDNVAIDTGCVYGGALTALVIEDDKIIKFYQQEKLKADAKKKIYKHKKNKKDGKQLRLSI